MTATLTMRPDALTGDPAFAALKGHVIATTGLMYYDKRGDELAQQVGERLTELGLSSCDAYLDVLRSESDGETELDVLISKLTIGETYFFRHREMFQALEAMILPQLIERNRQRRQLRIWSAGCSIGAESYSLSTLLRRKFGQQIRGWNITIVGTDINRDFLAKARRGAFDAWAFRGSPDWLQSECFSQVDVRWQLAPCFMQGVEFEYHNLARHHFPSLAHNLFAFDLILCRNVMIYGDESLRERIVSGCRECLVDGGWLLVGHAESDAAAFRDFRRVVFDGAILYQKDDAAERLIVTTSENARLTAQGKARRLPNDRRPPEENGRAASDPTMHQSFTESRGPSAPAATTSSDKLHMVRQLANAGKLEAAAARCEEVLRADRLDVTATFLMALICGQLGLHERTEKQLRQTLFLDRKCAMAHYCLGLVLFRQGRTIAAQQSFRNTLRLITGRPDTEVVSPTDDITVAELIDLVQIHLDKE